MECADILHVLWAGICRDSSGSLIMDTAEWCNLASLQGSGWDERLQTLHHYCVNWCANNGIRPSTVEQLSPLNFLALLQQLTTQICQCSWPYVQYVHHSSIANSLSFFLTIFSQACKSLEWMRSVTIIPWALQRAMPTGFCFLVHSVILCCNFAVWVWNIDGIFQLYVWQTMPRIAWLAEFILHVPQPHLHHAVRFDS